MLFNSYVFLFVFLPITWLVYHVLARRGPFRLALGWLVLASLFFYGWWNPAYLGLILCSILVNYGLGRLLGMAPGRRHAVLWTGIAFNLGLLGYFKYANFLVDNLDRVAGMSIDLAPVVLPLAISFFTFQQIAFLVDNHRGQVLERDFLRYTLFVTFFPQLIAGPIVHHKEMLPQFLRPAARRVGASSVAVGLVILSIGLFKKVVLADGVAEYATRLFTAAEAGATITFFEAWLGAFAYSFQLYFDFSGYSDMAVGLARLFGIRLPLNFNSPYKAASPIEFWRRWHMTLSRFLRDYLYIPLGGGRRGRIRQYVNLVATMVLGGLWHGAGWTFVLWGALHGLYLLINHAWNGWRRQPRTGGKWRGRLATFVAVTIAWVLFRAESLDGALAVYGGMAGLNGVVLPEIPTAYTVWAPDWLRFESRWIDNFGHNRGIIWVAGLWIVAWALPNTQQIMRRFRPAFEVYAGEVGRSRWRRLEWRMTPAWAVAVSVLLATAVLSMPRISEFLYFQF